MKNRCKRYAEFCLLGRATKIVIMFTWAALIVTMAVPTMPSFICIL